jgi:hypothetical protein|tara:strand:+ start:195 stop:1715 length:1521 start_codon:yes stop_codon:yes gene_type:complete
MAITGATLTGLPETVKRTLSTNYIDFATLSASDGWAQQYLPDLMAREAEIFGNRTIGGFLEQVGAEEAMTSDQVVWSEQGRLHFAYKGYIANATAQTGNNSAAGGTIELETTIDGHTVTDSATVVDHGVRAGDTILVANASAVARCFVTAVAGKNISVAPYDATNNNGQLGAITGFSAGSDGDVDYTILVYGSEYRKGSNGRTAANQPGFKSLTNKPIILKDMYHVSGSDASQIGWVEVSGEVGQNGYMWYLKAEGDTRARFSDYLEMSLIESVKGDAAQSTADTLDATGGGDYLQATFGTEGLFSAIETRGNIATGVNGINAATDLAEFDAMLAELDRQGSIEENMMFVNRATALAMDDMLASMNSYGAGGTSYGVFDNSEDMALNLGFSGFRRGSYDFYKSDWKYLNDSQTRGAINAAYATGAIRGVMVPAGVSSVYDQQMGKNMKRPFLHVRYRASQTDDRRLKTWVTGSVGATTSDLDAMEVHYLSERCLVVQGANNFFLLK